MTGSGPKSVLVFGATGTIGRAVLAELTAQGHHVTVVGRRAVVGVESIAVDVADPEPKAED